MGRRGDEEEEEGIKAAKPEEACPPWTDGRTDEREGWEWDQTPFRSAVVLQKQRRQLRVQLHDVIHSP